MKENEGSISVKTVSFEWRVMYISFKHTDEKTIRKEHRPDALKIFPHNNAHTAIQQEAHLVSTMKV